MSRAFDWSPWLDEGEEIVWRAEPNMLPIWIMAVSAITVMIGIILGMHDGSTKAHIGLAMAPWIVGILALALLGTLFVTNRYCATTRRIMTLHHAPWRKHKLSSIDRCDAEVQAKPRRPTVVRHRRTRKQILSMNLSGRDEEGLLSLMKREGE